MATLAGYEVLGLHESVITEIIIIIIIIIKQKMIKKSAGRLCFVVFRSVFISFNYKKLR